MMRAMPAIRKKRKPKKAPQRTFWTEGRYGVEDQLPLPAVDYWKPYAAFLGFSPSVEEPFRLCECARGAITNALRIEREYQLIRGVSNSPPHQRFPTWATDVDFFALPADPDAATRCFRFGDKLCHRCNMATPSRSFCDPMYGSSFQQTYGWYTNLNLYRFGVRPASLEWLPDAAPPELAALMAAFPEGRAGFKDMGSPAARAVERFAENATRQEFGVNLVGEGWVSESLLAKLVGQIFPGQEIVRHLRPDWLEKLELDIWLPGINTAIEYQGQQHFHPIKAWGGQEALDGVRHRDARKAELCERLEIRLVTIDYTEPLTYEHVSQRLMVPTTRPKQHVDG